MMPDLGAYGVYVLGAYGFTLAVMVVLCLASVRRARRVRAALDALETRLRQTPEQ